MPHSEWCIVSVFKGIASPEAHGMYFVDYAMMPEFVLSDPSVSMPHICNSVVGSSPPMMAVL
jgi:hypothetical protein